MYFAIKPINNSTYYNREALELIKNLQSLGVNATGRMSVDRQTLQVAEYEKLKQTLSSSNEQQIQKAEVPFDIMLQEGNRNNRPTNRMQAINLNQDNEGISKAVEEQTGAMQIAKMNKFMLGIAA